MLAVLVLGSLIVYFSKPRKSYPSLPLLVAVILTIIYCVVIALEGGTSQGFVFSWIHMRPESMFVAVLGTLWALSAVGTNKIWVYLTLVALSFYVARLVPIVVTQSYVTTREVVRSPLASRDDKMKLNWGGFYDFAQFVNSHTPADVTIAIPPRSNIHPLVGNNSFFWYFAYPRQLVSLPLHVEDLSSVQYIVIDGGDTTWPDLSFKAKHIWYLRDGGAVTELSDTIFDPQDARYKGSMGLIEIEGDSL
jgi:hypothetical protein